MITDRISSSQANRGSHSSQAAAPAAPSVRTSGAEGAALSSDALRLSDQVATLLAVVAAHDRISPADFIARAVCRRAEDIGIAFLTLQGGEEASRLAHNQEVGRSNRPPATSHNRESDDGGGGNPAAPAGGGPAGKDAARAPP